MLSNKTLSRLNILFTCWVLVFGFVGILAVGQSSDGKTIPESAWYCIAAMFVAFVAVHYIRKEKKRRDHEEFLEKFPHMRRLYE